jgi:4-amino-4-deoxy-L-arabinose transferase-like glycosyltransferase
VTIAPEIFIARFDRLARSALAPVLLLALCLGVYVPGLAAIPVVDRDEARFAQASRQMFESVALPASERDATLHDGGLVVPKVAGQPRLNKPPLVYWLEAASAAVFTGGEPLRDALWMYRLPSAVCAIIAVLLTFRLGWSMVDASTGLLAAALLAVCPMVVWDAHQARADQLLLAATTSAVFALWSIHERGGRGWGRAAWLWGSVAVGILAKGPITPMVVVLTAVAFCWTGREWRWLGRTRPAAGLVLLLGVVGPWAMVAAGRVGFPVFWGTLVGETVGRSAAAFEGHWAPPGYHTVLLAVLFWPGSLLTLTAFLRTVGLAVRIPPPEGAGLVRRVRSFPSRFRGRVLGRTPELFLAAWIIPSWVVFEMVATKLPHYTLPMYPAIAIISARAVLDGARARVDFRTAARIGAGLGVWLVLGLAITAAVPVGLALLGGGWAAVAAAVAGAAVSVWLLVGARAQASEGLLLSAQVRSLAAAVVFAMVTLGFVLPRAATVWVWPRAVAAVPRAGRRRWRGISRTRPCSARGAGSGVSIRTGRSGGCASTPAGS